MTIRGNRILRNGRHRAYRDAQAVIENNVIDGIDLAVGSSVGGGGVGIGRPGMQRPRCGGNGRRYWKDRNLRRRSATVENVVEQMRPGAVLWDAGQAAARVLARTPSTRRGPVGP
jgi:hypothetical protein